MKIELIFHVFIFVVYKWLKKLRKNVYFSNTFWLYQLRVSRAQFLSNSNLNSEILILDTLYCSLTDKRASFLRTFILRLFANKMHLIKEKERDH